jgi:hypothetical protein
VLFRYGFKLDDGVYDNKYMSGYKIKMANPNDPNYYNYGQQAQSFGWGDTVQGDGISFDMDSNFGQEQ